LALLKDKEEIIFLSDIKLNSDKQTHAIHDLEKQFFSNGYKLYYNSKSSSIGVGILISNYLSINITDTKVDNLGNYLLLKVHQKDLILGSVYGPNDNNLAFFTELESDLKSFGCGSVILGGDWNATWDPRDAADNIDTINMANIPSRIRTNAIQNLANSMLLMDPFRLLYPVKREFTNVPNARQNLNRSRIDFFQ
jgi:exonuclease III